MARGSPQSNPAPTLPDWLRPNPPIAPSRPSIGKKSGTKRPPIDFLIGIILLGATFALYAPTFANGFVEYDDPQYITDNPVVKQGLTFHGISWAFTTNHFANWLPITWLSHMAVVSLFGLNPGGHHAFDAFLHACNASLVFFVLKSMTGRRWPSAVAAALFAVHPLRVESVAWVAEQKDVLSGLFSLLTLLTYTSYVRRPSLLRYAAVAILFSLGLMSKTMLVTLPFLLLLLDIWPLNRGRWSVRSLAEKVPLLILSAIACAWTMRLQRSGHAMSGQDIWSIGQRTANAVVSVPRYLGATFWPAKLSAFYPHPDAWPAWAIAGSVGSIAVLSAAGWLVRRNMPYVLVGWLWFLGMLVPVSGIVQAGLQSMADRYSYLPSIGLIIALVWAGEELCALAPAFRRAATPLAAGILAALAVGTWLREPAWRSTRDLFENALAVEEQNWLAHDWVGRELSMRGDETAAIAHYRRAMELNPRHPYPLIHLGGSLRRMGRLDEAIGLFRRGVQLGPDAALTHMWLGIGISTRLAKRGAPDSAYAEADREFATAAGLDADDPSIPVAWAYSMASRGRLDRARELTHAALEIDPANPSASNAMETIDRLGPANSSSPATESTEPGL